MSLAQTHGGGELPVIDFQVNDLIHRVVDAREAAADKLSASSDATKTQKADGSGSNKSLVEQMAAGAISRDLAQAFSWLPPIGPDGNPECRLGNRLHDYMNAKTEAQRKQAINKLKEEVSSGASPHAAQLLKEVMTFDAGVRLHDAEQQLSLGKPGANREQLLEQKSQAIKDLASLAYADKFAAARTILERDPNVSEVLAAKNAIIAYQTAPPDRAAATTPGETGTGNGGTTPNPSADMSTGGDTGTPTDIRSAGSGATTVDRQRDAARSNDAGHDQPPQVSPAEAQARAMVKDLGPASSPEDFHKAAEDLKKLGSPEAKSWEQWADANEQVANMTMSAGRHWNLDADIAVKQLAAQAKDGNPYARQALAAALVGTADPATINHWLDRFPNADGKPVYVPNLNGLDDTDKKNLDYDVAHVLGEDFRRTLSASEMAAAAIALSSDCVQSKDSFGTTKNALTLVLQGSLTASCGPEERRSTQELSAAMSGIVGALECGVKPNADLLLVISRTAAQPAFTEHFPQIQELAEQGNKTAIRILADVAGGIADGQWPYGAKTQPISPLVEPARKTLEQIGQETGKRADVVQAIRDTLNMHYSEQTSQGIGANEEDRHALDATMGKLAAGLDPVRDGQLLDGVRAALRKGLDQFKFHRQSDDGYKSAADGMLAMAKLLKPEDIDKLLTPPNLSKEVADALVRNADGFSQDIRNYAIAKLEQNLKTPAAYYDPGTANEEKMSAIRGLAAFAKYLNKDDIDLIASFGGDANHHRGGTSGAERIGQLGLSNDQIPAFQAVCGEALLYILARSPNAPTEQTGPREEAYAAFRDLPWPIRDGNGGYVPSEKSEQLKSALLDYYSGHPYDITLAAEINRIVDGAKLPRPAADIIHRLGVGDPNNPHDPAIREKADQIVHNYDSPQESGVEVLRRVVANVEMINALPANQRANFMGWTNLPEADKQALGWVKEPTADQQAAMHWEQMSPDQQEAFRWLNVHVDVQQVLGQMANKKLSNSLNGALLQDLTPKVEALRHDREVEVERLKDQLTQLNEQRKGKDGQHGALGDLTDQAKAGVSFGAKVANIFHNGRDQDFNAKQSQLLQRLHDIDDQLAATQKKLQEADESQHGLAVAKEVGEYRRLLNIGDQNAADKLAISMWREHGPELAVLAPNVWRDLTINTDHTLQGESILQRLKDRGKAQVGVVPGYDTGEDGLQQALGTAPGTNADRPGLLQIQGGKLDTDALRAYMFGRVDHDETLLKVSDASRNIGTDLDELSKMFQAAQKGTVYESFIADAKDKAGRINAELAHFTDDDRKHLSTKIADLETAREAMKNKPDADQKALAELDEHIKTYKQMQEILDPNSPTRKMLHDIENNKLRPDTITKWLKENGITIAVAIAACAATVSACATFGITSPAAVGLWVAVGGLVAREATNEILYQVNQKHYTGYGDYDNNGSRIGDWYRHIDPNDVAADLKNLGLHVAVPYAVEIARDWAAFVATFGLTKYFLQGGGGAAGRLSFTKAMASVFETPPANLAQLAALSERAVLMENGQYGSAASRFVKQFMQQFGKELAVNAGFTGAQTGTQSAVESAIGKEQMEKLGGLGQFGLSFAISTGLAMGAGYRHAKMLESAELKPGNVFDFKLSPATNESDFIDYMRREGYQIKQTSPGKWEALPINARPGTPPINMENVTGDKSNTAGGGGSNESGQPTEPARRQAMAALSDNANFQRLDAGAAKKISGSIDPDTPVDNLKALNDLLRSPMVERLLATGDEQAIQKFRDSLIDQLRQPQFAQRAQLIAEIPREALDKGYLTPELMMSKTLDARLLQICQTAADHLLNLDQLSYLKDMRSSDGQSQLDRLRAELSQRLQAINAAPENAQTKARVANLDCVNAVVDELSRLKDTTARAAEKELPAKIERTLDILEYDRLKGKTPDKPYDAARVKQLDEQIEARLRESFIAKDQFKELVTQFEKPNDRAAAMEVLEQSVGNMQRQKLDSELSSVMETIRKAENGPKKITIVVFSEESAAKALGALARYNTRVDVEVRVLDPTTMKDGLSPSNPVLVLDDVNAASPQQKAFVKQLDKFYCSDINGFDKGINLWDLAKAKATGDCGPLQNKLKNIVERVQHLQHDHPELTMQQAVEQVLRGQGRERVTSEFKNAQLVNPDVESAAKKGDRDQMRSKDRAADSLYDQLTRSLIDPRELQSFIDKFPPQLRDSVASLLRDGTSISDYARMMEQIKSVHNQLVENLKAHGQDMKDVRIITQLEPGSSRDIVNHLFADMFGLKPENFVSTADLKAHPEAYKGKTLLYLDDYSYSGRQAAKLLSDPDLARAIEASGGRPVVAYLGGYTQKVDPFAGAAAKPDVIYGSAQLPQFYDNPAFKDLALIPEVLRLLGGKSGYLGNFDGVRSGRDIVVESGQLLPYEGPNNNIGLVRQFIDKVLKQHPLPNYREPAKVKSDAAPVPNEASIWRGGSPATKEEFKSLIDKTGAGVIIDLRGGPSAHDAEPNKVSDEQRWGAELGDKTSIEAIPVPAELPMRGTTGYSEFLKQINQFESVLNAAEHNGKKVYVHCEFGQDRTGMMLTLHEVISGKMTLDAALKEWEGFKPNGLDSDFNALCKKEFLQRLIADYRAQFPS